MATNRGIGRGITKRRSGGGVVFSTSKSFLFDGVDECFITDGIITNLNTATGTWSCWVKFTTVLGVSESILSMGDTNGTSDILLFKDSNAKILMQIRDTNVVTWTRITTNVEIADDTWFHIMIVIDGVDNNIYINNVAVAQSFSSSADVTRWIPSMLEMDNSRIGCRNRNSGGNSLFMDGNFTELAFWDSAIDSTARGEVYGGGTPSDLSVISTPPTIWWRPDNGVFSTDWTMTDEQGTGDTAVSDNMEEADRVEDAP